MTELDVEFLPAGTPYFIGEWGDVLVVSDGIVRWVRHEAGYFWGRPAWCAAERAELEAALAGVPLTCPGWRPGTPPDVRAP